LTRQDAISQILAIVDGAQALAVSVVAVAASSPAPVSSAAPVPQILASSQPGVIADIAAAKKRAAGKDAERDLVALNRKLAWLPLTDLANAQRFVERQRGKLIWCESIGWLWWDGRRWCRDGAAAKVMIAVHQTVRAIQDEAKAISEEAQGLGKKVTAKDVGTSADESAKKRAKRRVALAKHSPKVAKWGRDSEANAKLSTIAKNAGPYLAVATDQLDADRLMINVQNGTLVARRDWTTAPPEASSWIRCSDYIRLKPHDPEDLVTKVSPAAFNPAATCERFNSFLAEVQPALPMRRFLQQWKGYGLTGDVGEHRMAMFVGKGRNGKSVFEDATAHVAGDFAETVPIETFLATGREVNANSPSPARALLHNARTVRTSEPNKGASLDEGFIKLVTGGEPIQARNLNL
jgi:putative DNA primase/helicase